MVPKIQNKSDEERRAEIERHLIRQEAKIGADLFGPIPKGHRREFFCLDEHTWVWHEEWTENGQHHVVSTRYNIRPDGVLKQQNGGGYQILSVDEARNLYKAAKMYCQLVRAEYYKLLQAA